jgi:hypothetical protein
LGSVASFVCAEKQNKKLKEVDEKTRCLAKPPPSLPLLALLASSVVSNDLEMAVRDLDSHVPGCLLL